MNSRHIVDRFLAARERGESMVLVTVYDTLGSTYSKAGTRMLIMSSGTSQGLISGGCLEGDLTERARAVLASGAATAVTYDLRDEADELFGLGIGCNGLIRVLLQPLMAENDYEPMASIASILLGKQPGGLAIVVASDLDEIRPGASLVMAGEDVCLHNAPPSFEPRLAAGIAAALDRDEAHLAVEPDGFSVLYATVTPIPRVLILGAGLDAVPLVNLVAELGWRVAIADHRPGYLERDAFVRAESRQSVRPATLDADLSLDEFDAIIVMSHHLLTDREYLRHLAAVDAPYLGLLGPPARRRRLLDDLGDAGRSLEKRLRGPVGVDIGADSAESIALSIVAEVQAVLAGR